MRVRLGKEGLKDVDWPANKPEDKQDNQRGALATKQVIQVTNLCEGISKVVLGTCQTGLSQKLSMHKLGKLWDPIP